MGVDAQMVVRLSEPISDDELIQASYRLAEACGRSEVFWLSSDDDLARGECRRALNRVDDTEDGLWHACGVAQPDGFWLWVSLGGRYYGPGYERGDLWSYVSVAEWLERIFPGAVVYYGGDSSEMIVPWTHVERETFIAHWAKSGGRPYYAGEGKTYGRWYGDEHAKRPICPLCQHPATQYGSGRDFASWQCGGCSRHWVWVGGELVKAFGPSRDFDPFAAAKGMREASTA